MATELQLATENTDIHIAGSVVRLDTLLLTRSKVRCETGSQGVICVAEPVQASGASAKQFPCFPWLFFELEDTWAN